MKFRSWQLFLILGLVSLVLALMFLPVAISGFVGVSGDGSGEVLGYFAMIFCVFPTFAMTVVFLLLAVLLRKNIKDLAELAEMLRSYRVTTMADLARKMDNTEEVSRKKIKLCQKKGLIEGKFDEKETTFMTSEYLSQNKNIINGWKCTSCGDFNDVVILAGEVGKCSSCGVMLDRTAGPASDANGPPVQQGAATPHQHPPHGE